jgi:thiamine kinase-like enzyme
MPSLGRLPAIESLLEETFQLSDWKIARPADGQQKECYVAKTADFTVFLKFDGKTPAGVLQRLGELGVAPRMLRTGNLEGRAYVLQEYLVGKHPRWWWFADHLPLLAQVTRRYHTDVQLKQLLSGSSSREYHEQIACELAALKAQMTSLQGEPACMMTLSSVFDDLKSQANQLHPVSLSPVHTDPNGANILLRDEKMTFVDWDDMLLSDPMRDVSQWLGWYVPQDRWLLFFREYGLFLDQPLRTRVYWWSARASFANVLWHIEQGYDYEVFLRDTLAALHQEITPHQVFHEES